MENETDWAEQIVWESQYSSEGKLLFGENRLKAMAMAIRKAFADGMRKAVAMTDDDKWWELSPGESFPDFKRNKYEREALAEAKRIEDGEL